ncbi:hypothetical protein M3568_11895 [Priestia flexa]|uniref:hypothetical protein n=1 Tax=Priestia flexa TaxID=86664 RepID=UPI00203F7936|nr:hypothetical protein [Priestia flexa]MCM3067122.1 hypothetical protein [Priestia flexa]
MTGEKVEYYFRKVGKEEIKEKGYLPDEGWEFNWLRPLTHKYEVFGLITKERPDEVEGLIAVMLNDDPDFMCVDIEILESAPRNKKEIKGYSNLRRMYIGVGRCLIAFACQYSLDNGFDGYVGLAAKTSKMELYESMGAMAVNGYGFDTGAQGYMFTQGAALNIVKEYFPGGVLWWPEQM